MIFIGLGGNLNSLVGSPQKTCLAAMADLGRAGVTTRRCSPWYETAPVPISDQPWFVNAVAEVETQYNPQELLSLLHTIEAKYHRVRSGLNGARTLDLDLLAYNDVVQDADLKAEKSCLVLPHPRLHERAFVLLPLNDLAPDWRHPDLGLTAAELLHQLSPGQKAVRLPEADQGLE
tara:strand:- start:1179 stop:1706 length:528 start_codon:yes stop_codon:yes gene_type:complete